MSKLVVSRYRVPTQEERRASLQKIALVRQMLQRCLALREALERFEAVEGEHLAPRRRATTRRSPSSAGMISSRTIIGFTIACPSLRNASIASLPQPKAAACALS